MGRPIGCCHMGQNTIGRDMCYEPGEIDNARENGKKELPFEDVYDGKDCSKLVCGEDLPEFGARYLGKQMELIVDNV